MNNQIQYKSTIEEFNDGGIRFNNSRIVMIILILLLSFILMNKSNK